MAVKQIKAASNPNRHIAAVRKPLELAGMDCAFTKTGKPEAKQHAAQPNLRSKHSTTQNIRCALPSDDNKKPARIGIRAGAK